MLTRVGLSLILILALAGPAWAASNVLTWTDNATNEITQHIERKAVACADPSMGFTQIATVGPNVTTFADATVLEETTYCYRVAASNTAGKSAFSNTAERFVPPTVPAAQSGLGVAGGP